MTDQNTYDDITLRPSAQGDDKTIANLDRTIANLDRTIANLDKPMDKTIAHSDMPMVESCSHRRWQMLLTTPPYARCVLMTAACWGQQ